MVWSVAFSPDGKRLATGGNDQAVRVWHAETLREDHVYRGHGSEVWSVIWSREGDKIISAGKDATIRIWTATPALGAAEVLDVTQRPIFSSASSNRLSNSPFGSFQTATPPFRNRVAIIELSAEKMGRCVTSKTSAAPTAGVAVQIRIVASFPDEMILSPSRDQITSHTSLPCPR